MENRSLQCSPALPTNTPASPSVSGADVRRQASPAMPSVSLPATPSNQVCESATLSSEPPPLEEVPTEAVHTEEPSGVSIHGCTGATSSVPMVTVQRYCWRPKEPGSLFGDGRPCQQQYSRCRSYPGDAENYVPKVIEIDPLDEPDVRALLGENMGWPQNQAPPSRQRLFCPRPEDSWLAPEIQTLEIRVTELSICWREVVYDAEIRQRGGWFRAMINDLRTGW